MTLRYTTVIVSIIQYSIYAMLCRLDLDSKRNLYLISYIGYGTVCMSCGLWCPGESDVSSWKTQCLLEKPACASSAFFFQDLFARAPLSKLWCWCRSLSFLWICIGFSMLSWAAVTCQTKSHIWPWPNTSSKAVSNTATSKVPPCIMVAVDSKCDDCFITFQPATAVQFSSNWVHIPFPGSSIDGRNGWQDQDVFLQEWVPSSTPVPTS